MTAAEATGLEGNTGFLLSVSSARAVSAANRALADLGLKARSFTALSVLVSNDGISQREIAQTLQMDPSQMVALVDSLEALGLVERCPDPRDRRQHSVVATARGVAIREEAAGRVAQSEEMVLANLNAEERDQLHDLLLRVALTEKIPTSVH